MADEFIELLDSRNKVSLYDKKVDQFSKKSLLKKDIVTLEEKSHLLSTKKKQSPVISVNKNGNIVQQIEITCRCGENLTIELQYGE